MSEHLSEETRLAVKEAVGNTEGLSEAEATNLVIKAIADRFYWFCERNLMVRDIDGQIVPLVPNYAQKVLITAVLEDLTAGRPVRYIILKARKMGFSTIIEALCYWWTTTHRNITSLIMAHDSEGNKVLYEMFRRYYDYSHAYWQPVRKYNTKNDLTFDLEDKEKEAMKARGEKPNGLGSQIKTMVAKEGKGRGDTIMFFHGSEVASWDASADVLSGALQAIPFRPNTFAFLESTAQGVGGYFYNEWQAAKKGDGAFRPFFFAWHEHPDYELNEKVENYDEEELELLEIFEKKGYPSEAWDKKLAWRRYKFRSEFRTDPQKFYQEYPKDDIEAFLASGRPRFDIRSLMKMQEVADAAAPPVFGELYRKKSSITNKEEVCLRELEVRFRTEDPSPLKIWEKPQEKVKYTIGVDVADGIEIAAEKVETDYSVIDIMRSDNLKTVARWRGHIDPDLLAGIVMELGEYYNFALVGIEVNNHGLTVVQHMRNKFYRNLYMRETSQEDQFQTRTSKMGWLTNRQTKKKIIDNLAAAIREGDILDLDIAFIRECMTYAVDDEGRTNAQPGTFDDCVMAKAINLEMTDWNSYNQDYAKEHITKRTRRQTHATNSTADEFALIANPTKRHSRTADLVRRRKAARRRNARTT